MIIGWISRVIRRKWWFYVNGIVEDGCVNRFGSVVGVYVCVCIEFGFGSGVF